MSAQTLLTEILSETRNYNPQASLNEIAEGLFSIIEREIIPKVLMDISLPKFPSWKDLIVRSRELQRTKKRIKPTGNLTERRLLIQQVESLKQMIYWDGGDTTIHFPPLSDLGNLSRLLAQFDLPSVKEQIPKHELGKAKELALEEPDNPYLRISPSPETKYNFTLSEELQHRIVSNYRFEEIFRRIEISLRELVAERSLKTNINIDVKSDIEIPSWEKYIFKISPSSKLSFKERMNIWTTFDIRIRNSIQMLRKMAVDSEQIEYLENLNRNLFVHIEL